MKSKILPAESEICALVDCLITPEAAEKEAAAFIRILLTLVDEADDDRRYLANLAARRAFEKTMAFDAAFTEFTEQLLTGIEIDDKSLIDAGTGNN